MIDHSPYCSALDEYVNASASGGSELQQEVLVDDSKIFLVTEQSVIDDWVECKQLPDNKDTYLDSLILLDVMNDYYPWYLGQGCPNDVY